MALPASEFAAGEIELVAEDGQEAVVGLALHLVRASVDPEHESSHGPILPPSPGASLLTWRAKLVYLRPVKCLVTGGAGFVGSTLALLLQRDVAGIDVTAFDNLRRRGSELALDRLRAGGVTFRHGDVRSADDLSDAGPFDVLIECSAEPSVHAGYDGSPAYVLDTNLTGAARCLDAARRYDASVVFLSTSRVYSIPALVSLPLERQGDRLELPAGASGPGWSARGITERFPTSGPRSLYGTSKLAAELLVEEYHAMYGLRTVVNRCGLIAGTVADGQGGSGPHRVLGGSTRIWRRALVHGLRR